MKKLFILIQLVVSFTSSYALITTNLNLFVFSNVLMLVNVVVYFTKCVLIKKIKNK